MSTLANGESAIKDAARDGDAGDVAAAYSDYVASMEAKHQPVKPLKDILGR